MKKLFKVKKVSEPEYGASTVEFVKYFTAGCRETVETIVEARYGKAKYYAYDREETKYEITELEVEEL
jgi:hypothetical protein